MLFVVNLKTIMEEEDDWRQCAEWLNRCQVIPDDHPALGPDGNAIHLVQALMDGVALCHLLSTLSNHELDIRSMKDFSHMPQNSQFLCFQNLRLFTQLCEKEFDIPRNLLFQPGDIYHAKNFGKAIATLSKLSYSRRAQLTGIPYVFYFFCRLFPNIVVFHQKIQSYNQLMNIIIILRKSLLQCR